MTHIKTALAISATMFIAACPKAELPTPPPLLETPPSTEAPAEPKTETSLTDILEAVREEPGEMSEADAERIEQFKTKRDSQPEQLEALRQELAAIEANGQDLSRQFNENEDELERLDSAIDDKLGDYPVILERYRVVTGKVQAQLASSFITFEFPGRFERIETLAEQRAIAAPQDISVLPQTLLLHMQAQSEITVFETDVRQPDGSIERASLLRIGGFTAATTDFQKFVRVMRSSNGEKEIRMIENQPDREFAKAMRAYQAARPGDIVRIPFDPTKGQLLGARDGLRPEIREILERDTP